MLRLRDTVSLDLRISVCNTFDRSHLALQNHYWLTTLYTQDMASRSVVNPLKEVKVIRHRIPAHNFTPNTSIQNKPLIFYKNAFKDANASQIETHLSGIGVVEPQWRYTMYTTSHFHSTSHEVLCIASGEARLCFGHEDNPNRVEAVLGKGDVIVVPAGVAHRLLEEIQRPFEMVGSYPKGCSWDMCYGKKGEESRVKKIASLAWFDTNPIFGDGGPACSV